MSDNHPPAARRPSPRTTRVFAIVALSAIAVLATFALWRGGRAADAALDAKRALVRAEADLRAARADPARAHLLEARDGFARARKELRGLGPVRQVLRVVPLVRVQVRGMEAFADAGLLLAEAGIPISDAAAGISKPGNIHVPVEGALDTLRKMHVSMQAGVAALDRASARVRDLDGSRLLGPLNGARTDLLTRLPRIRERATSAEQGLGALVTFAGGSGPRRYLVFSQNPDEVRPTGGFIGTYGVLGTSSGKLKLERYDGIEGWTRAHPQAVVPPEEAGSPFRFYDPPLAQTIANVNDSPNWSEASRLALRLWEAGGEEPVDGTVSFTPAFLARAIAVLGPVEVPGYGETVDAGNVVDRIDFHTHVETPPAGADRKDFVAALAEQVVQKLLAAPAQRWQPLAKAIGTSFDAREAMVWSKDSDVVAAVSARRWDGSLPDVFGDFFYGAEFEFAAKNGRALRRTYDHRVELRANGSARISTTLTIANTAPPARLNQHALSYITVYGPQGARLDTAMSDPDAIEEPDVNGHPGRAWFRTAQPLDKTTLTVVWEVPEVTRRLDDGSLQYGLWWMRLPDHTGDVVNLQVEPPAGWRWSGDAPPARVELERDFTGTWTMVRGL